MKLFSTTDFFARHEGVALFLVLALVCVVGGL